MYKAIIFVFVLVFLVASCDIFKKSSEDTSSAAPQEETQEGSEVEIPIEKAENKIIERAHYNPSATIQTDIIHTTLWVSFDWQKQQLNGKAEITASPYFYPTDSLILDAKAMEIHDVSINGEKLTFVYNDKKFLRIGLDKEYNKGEKYKVTVNYTAKPEEKEAGGSSAITSDKGLYFINPKGEDPNQMPQIWTQGETEASSVWFPTIDRPNQKMTQEIYMTVGDKYATLSNGRLVESVKNNDGTRTDHWKQEIPHVPYLAAMAVGEFSVVKDQYVRPDGTKMPVYYYVEPEWEEHAMAIFGETPEMIKHFSELFGVEYPWEKYHSIIVREYVSGAMENTGAVIFGDQVYKTKRELIDMNDHSIIAHELAHHWFGNIVTCESWANLPLNESFANYAQYLWDEHYYGIDQADYYAEKEAMGYYQQSEQMGHHDMIWFDYDEKEDMFDAHSYNKGGRILHMLRNYVGDDAFFASLKLYLTRHEFEPVEIHQLRLAFEDVTGEDLNWFFNQWFFETRHPELSVDMTVDSAMVELKIEQVQDLDKAPLYKLPLKVAVYSGGEKVIHDIVVDKNINTFSFPLNGALENIILDDQRMLLGSISFKKPKEFYHHQFYNAKRLKDREEGLVFGSRLKEGLGDQLIFDALEDEFWYIRQLAVEKMTRVKRKQPEKVFAALKSIVETDINPRVRATAVYFLANEMFQGEYESSTRSVINHAIEKDSSYNVLSKAMSGLTKGTEKDIQKAMEIAEQNKGERSSILRGRVAQVFADYGDASKLDFFTNSIDSGYVRGYELIGVLGHFTKLLEGQNVKTQTNYLPYFEKWHLGGNPYINAVMPMNIMRLKRTAEEKGSDLKAKVAAFEKDGDTQKAEETRIEMDAWYDFAEDVNKILRLIMK